MIDRFLSLCERGLAIYESYVFCQQRNVAAHEQWLLHQTAAAKAQADYYAVMAIVETQRIQRVVDTPPLAGTATEDK